MEIHHIQAAQQFSEERFTKVDIIKNRRSVAFLLNFLPDQHMKPHSHPNRELFLYVIEGEGTLILDGKHVAVSTGDILYCHPEQQIGFTNTSNDRVSIYVTMTKIAD